MSANDALKKSVCVCGYSSINAKLMKESKNHQVFETGAERAAERMACRQSEWP